MSPSGSDSGNGSIDSPLLTVQAAVNKAGSNATIVLRGGTYNQSVNLFTNNNLIIESYPGEAVWFDGATPVSGWNQVGSTWVHSGWTAQFDSSQSFTKGSNAGGFVNPSHPMAANPDQTFFDGSQLSQVSGTPGPGQFAVNYSADTLTVGSNPAGHSVTASNVDKAFVIGGGYDTLRGFGIRDYATPLPELGAIFVGGSVGHETFENLDIENNATIGIFTAEPGITINHVTTNANGMSGMQIGTAAYGQDGAGEIIEHSEMNGNNTQMFNVAPASAGIKVGRINGIKIIDNVVENNINASGIWTDQSVSNFVIAGNTVTGNGACSGCYGIEAELSDTGIIANNVESGSEYGITAFDTGNLQIYNNEVTGNSVWGVGLSQDERRQATSGLPPQPSVPWIVQNVVVANNVFGPSGGFQFYCLDKSTGRPASSMNITINGNLFSADQSASDPVMVGWGGSDNHTVSYYTSPSTLDSSLGRSWKDAQESTRGASAAQMLVDAKSANVAVPLPADVAASIGVATGLAVTGPTG